MSIFKDVTPVTLPPGRLRLATSPAATGSAPVANTIGMVDVAAWAARVAGMLAGVTITATLCLTRSAASGESLSNLFSAQRYVIVTFLPSIKPASAKPFRKASMRLAFPWGETG